MVSNMNDYQNLLQGIKVPKDWPVQAVRSQIVNVVRSGIHYRLAGKQVVTTVANVSAIVVENDFGIGFTFKKIEVTDDDDDGINVDMKVDLILPMSILIYKPGLDGPDNSIEEKIPVETKNLKFHYPPLQMPSTMLDHLITIAVPDIKHILQSKVASDNEMYSCVVKSTYRADDNIQLSTILRKFTIKEDPIIYGTKISDEWNVVCYDQIPKPQRNRWKDANITAGICFGFISFVLLMYFVFK